MTPKFAFLGLALSAAVLSSAPASAATTFSSGPTYTVSPQYGTGPSYNVFQDSGGHNSWYRGVSFTANGHSETGAAGLFRLKASGGGLTDAAFLAFCLSPTTYLSMPTDYKVSSDLGSLGTTALGQLGALVKNAWSLVNGDDSAAAFQVAAWEIVTENGAHSLDLAHDSFRLTGAPSAVAGLAGTWLGNIGSTWSTTQSGYTLLKWTDHSSQNSAHRGAGAGAGSGASAARRPRRAGRSAPPSAGGLRPGLRNSRTCGNQAHQGLADGRISDRAAFRAGR